jgi:hypothetical protein
MLFANTPTHLTRERSNAWLKYISLRDGTSIDDLLLKEKENNVNIKQKLNGSPE